MTWDQKALAATKGSKFGAILACALEVKDRGLPRFNGMASVTSDGYIMCNYVGPNGAHHMGAFVGAVDDLERNVVGLTAHLRLRGKDKAALETAIRGWIGLDYRSPPGLRFGGKS